MKESNPFLSSSDEDDAVEGLEESNPFADDVRSERKHRGTTKRSAEKEFDETNPFAEDAREETLNHQAVVSSPTNRFFQRNSGERFLVYRTKYYLEYCIADWKSYFILYFL